MKLKDKHLGKLRENCEIRVDFTAEKTSKNPIKSRVFGESVIIEKTIFQDRLVMTASIPLRAVLIYYHITGDLSRANRFIFAVFC